MGTLVFVMVQWQYALYYLQCLPHETSEIIDNLRYDSPPRKQTFCIIIIKAREVAKEIFDQGDMRDSQIYLHL